MKTGLNGTSGVGGSSIQRCQRLRQGGGETKMAFDTNGSGGNGREGGGSVGVGGGGGGDGGSHRRR